VSNQLLSGSALSRCASFVGGREIDRHHDVGRFETIRIEFDLRVPAVEDALEFRTGLRARKTQLTLGQIELPGCGFGRSGWQDRRQHQARKGQPGRGLSE
jgi:hypothetical protein